MALPTPRPPMNRRDFLATSSLALTALTQSRAADRPNERIRIAVMGVRSRGREIIRGFAKCPDTEVAAFVEVDERVVPNALKELAPLQKSQPKVEKDVRKLLEDQSITALVIG